MELGAGISRSALPAAASTSLRCNFPNAVASWRSSIAWVCETGSYPAGFPVMSFQLCEWTAGVNALGYPVISPHTCPCVSGGNESGQSTIWLFECVCTDGVNAAGIPASSEKLCVCAEGGYDTGFP